MANIQGIDVDNNLSQRLEISDFLDTLENENDINVLNSSTTLSSDNSDDNLTDDWWESNPIYTTNSYMSSSWILGTPYDDNLTPSFVDLLTGAYSNKTYTIHGYGGDDYLNGFGGGDTLYGDEGDDTLVANPDDWLYGGEGSDIFEFQTSGEELGYYQATTPFFQDSLGKYYVPDFNSSEDTQGGSGQVDSLSVPNASEEEPVAVQVYDANGSPVYEEAFLINFATPFYFDFNLDAIVALDPNIDPVFPGNIIVAPTNPTFPNNPFDDIDITFPIDQITTPYSPFL